MTNLSKIARKLNNKSNKTLNYYNFSRVMT